MLPWVSTYEYLTKAQIYNPASRCVFPCPRRWQHWLGSDRSRLNTDIIHACNGQFMVCLIGSNLGVTQGTPRGGVRSSAPRLPARSCWGLIGLVYLVLRYDVGVPVSKKWDPPPRCLTAHMRPSMLDKGTQDTRITPHSLPSPVTDRRGREWNSCPHSRIQSQCMHGGSICDIRYFGAGTHEHPLQQRTDHNQLKRYRHRSVIPPVRTGLKLRDTISEHHNKWLALERHLRFNPAQTHTTVHATAM